MGHLTKETRAKYFADWRAGIRRTKADEDGSYIDEPLTQEMREYDRSVRNRIRSRAQAKRDREEAAKHKSEWLRREIERLSVNPFSKLVNR